MESDNNLNDENNNHLYKLKKGKELFRANLKIFNKEYLNDNMEEVLQEIKSLNLSYNDLEELLPKSSFVNHKKILGPFDDNYYKEIDFAFEKKNKNERHWYIFIEVVQPNSSAAMYEQYSNMDTLIKIVAKSLQSYDAPYVNFFGDGIFSVFSIYENAIDLAIDVQKEVYKYNSLLNSSTKEFLKSNSKLCVRIGIGEGFSVYFKDFDKLIPWGKVLLLLEGLPILQNL